MEKRDYDAIVVGSGPNGLAAAITLQREGLSVLLIEAKSTIGGGLRSARLTLPGFTHDICSAIHPMAVASPFFQSLPLARYGLEYIHPVIPAAHPFDEGAAALLHRSPGKTARLLGEDEAAWKQVFDPLVASWREMAPDLLAPLHYPRQPLDMGRFGWKALASATRLARRFSTREARGLWAGMAAHSILPLHFSATSAIGLALGTVGHLYGWPMVKGGSENLAEALAVHFVSIGGVLQTGVTVRSLAQLPSAHAVLFDVTPQQLLTIAGHRLSSLYRWQLGRYRRGMGVFKIDWALGAPIPWTNEGCRQAGTLHLGGTLEEIAASEADTWKGRHVERPFVLLAQQSLFDGTRAPAGRHTAWAYCHVPNGSRVDRTAAIEAQVERFAPGFRDRILAKHVMTTDVLEAYNPNYLGGDINGGAITLQQLFTRPALRWSPYRTSARGLYLCSSSTPPGGGVHGMCGYHAAKRALKDLFGIVSRAR
jgi:phytoene dehydrogenase-like protein